MIILKLKTSTISYFITNLVIFFLLITIASVNAGHEGGIIFSDPTHGAQGHAEKADRKVIRKDWAMGADIAITLDQHLYHVFKSYIETFAKDNKIKIAIKEGTCGVSSGLLFRREVDMGGFCCPPSTADRVPGLQFHTIGISGLALIVNKANSVSSITLEQARAIFKGEIYRWSDIEPKNSLKSVDLLIRTLGRLHCKHRPGHWRLLLSHEDLFSPRMKEVGTIKDMMENVAENKGAIGYEVAWNIRRFNVSDRVKTLPINGYSPENIKHVASGNYPLYRTYNITSWVGDESASALLPELIKYLRKNVEEVDPTFGIVTARLLRENGWKFYGDELIGEPEK